MCLIHTPSTKICQKKNILNQILNYPSSVLHAGYACAQKKPLELIDHTTTKAACKMGVSVSSGGVIFAFSSSARAWSSCHWKNNQNQTGHWPLAHSSPPEQDKHVGLPSILLWYDGSHTSSINVFSRATKKGETARETPISPAGQFSKGFLLCKSPPCQLRAHPWIPRQK